MVIYLQLFIKLNNGSNLKYPNKIDDFKGGVFISRPPSFDTNKLPLPYIRFIKIWHENNKQSLLYSCIRELRNFFDTIISRRELLGISVNFQNPVHNSDIPKTGGRRWSTNKAVFPEEVFWLMIIVLYRIHHFISELNKKLINFSGRGFEYHCFWQDHNSNILLNINEVEKIFGLNLEKKIILNKKGCDVLFVPAVMLMPKKLKTFQQGNRYLIRPNITNQFIVALEAGLRHQSIRWLDCHFDKYIKNKTIFDESVYNLRVNTDKYIKEPWESYVAGRVINVLRSQRSFRNLIDEPGFKKEIFYSQDPESKWGKYRPLFSYEKNTGNPQGMTTYYNCWNRFLISMQPIIDFYEIDYTLLRPSEKKELNELNVTDVEFDFIENEVSSPHSTRANFISEKLTVFSAQQVGRYLTGQTPITVCYYAKLRKHEIIKIRKGQEKHFSKLNRKNFEASIPLDPECINPATEDSPLRKAISQDIDQAFADFGAACSNFFNDKNGFDIINQRKKQKLSFEYTHICPFGNFCPRHRYRLGYGRRCNFCDYAIRTVDNLPAIECEYRVLIDAMQKVEFFVKGNATKLTEKIRENAAMKMKEISEDFVGLELASATLRHNLNVLIGEAQDKEIIHVFQPEAVLKELEEVPLPDRTKETKYLIARLKELKTYPSLHSHASEMKIEKLRRNILCNRKLISHVLENDYRPNTTFAQTYSLIKNIIKVHGLSPNEVEQILNSEVTELIGNTTLELPFVKLDK